MPSEEGRPLTQVLKASLAQMDANGNDTKPLSPLTEAEAGSLDELVARIDKKLVQGLPDTITDAEIEAVVADLRAKRLYFIQEQAKGSTPRIKSNKKANNIREALGDIKIEF